PANARCDRQVRIDRERSGAHGGVVTRVLGERVQQLLGGGSLVERRGDSFQTVPGQRVEPRFGPNGGSQPRADGVGIHEPHAHPVAQARRAGLQIHRLEDAHALRRVFAGGLVVGAPEVRDVAGDDLDGVDWRLRGCGRGKQAERQQRVPHGDQGTLKADPSKAGPSLRARAARAALRMTCRGFFVREGTGMSPCLCSCTRRGRSFVTPMYNTRERLARTYTQYMSFTSYDHGYWLVIIIIPQSSGAYTR